MLDAGKPAHEAETLLRRALGHQAMLELPHVDWRILAALAEVALRRGNGDAAILLGKMSVAEIVRQIESPTMWVNSNWIADNGTRLRLRSFDRLIDCLKVAGRFPEAARVQQLMQQEAVFELARYDSAGDWRERGLVFLPAERDFVDRFEGHRQRLRALGFESRAEEVGDDRRAALAQSMEAEQARLSEWVDRALDERPAVAEPPPVGRSPAGRSTVLRFLRSGDRWTGVLDDPGGSRSFEIALAAAELARQIYRLRDLIQRRAPGWADVAAHLHEVLFGPIDQQLRDGIALEIVPSGPFSFLPFAALGDGRRCLADRMSIVLRTGIVTTRPPAETSRGWRVLALGATGVGDEALHHVPEELDAVGRVWPNARKIPAFEADTLARELAGGAEIVHLASHFRFDPANPGWSALELEGGRKLPLEELRSSRFDFSGVELLVLSACETALSARGLFGPETLAGLAQTKGVRSVLGTLWPVADAATARFMALFHEALSAQERPRPVQALRQAQRQFRDQAEARRTRSGRGGIGTSADDWRHPYFWAGYVLFGEEAGS
jgi:CHAT domain-containing protein